MHLNRIFPRQGNAPGTPAPTRSAARWAALGAAVWLAAPGMADGLVASHETVLQAAGSPTDDDFGRAIDIDGDRMVVGAAPDDPLSGMAYVYRKLPSGAFELEQKLVAPVDSLTTHDQYGGGVAIQGDHIAVGAPSAGTGKVFLFERSGETWSFVQQLEIATSDTRVRFGRGLELVDGWLAVGAYLQDDGSEDAGAIHIYRDHGTFWNPTQVLRSPFDIEDEWFGFSIDGNAHRLAVGAPGFPLAGQTAGATYVYGLVGSQWQLEQQLTAPHSERLGFSVALFGDHLLAGAPHTDGAGVQRGAVYSFQAGSSGFLYRQVLHGERDGELYGSSVALSRDSVIDTIGPLRGLIGARRFTSDQPISGRAQFIEWNTVYGWERGVSVQPETPHAYGQYGTDVALEGRTAAIGEVAAGTGFERGGAVHTYAIASSDWEPSGLLRSTDRDAHDELGAAVAAAGSLVVIGMPGDDDVVPDGGGALIYERQGESLRPVAKLGAERDASSLSRFGAAAATDGVTVVLGAPDERAPTPGSGAAYVYRADANGEWDLEARLVPSTPMLYAQFGSAVAVSRDRVAVAAPRAYGLQPRSGAVHIFVRNAEGEWTEEASLNELSGEADAYFGSALAMSGDRLAVAAPGYSQGRGLVVTYIRQGSNWSHAGALTAPDGAQSAAFGTALSMHGSQLAVSAPGVDAGRGAVYLHDLNLLGATSDGHLSTFAPASNESPSGYGCAIALEDDLLVIGSREDGTNGLRSGAATVYGKSGLVWMKRKLLGHAPSEESLFGTAVATSKGRVYVGATGYDGAGLVDSGAVYVSRIRSEGGGHALGFGDGTSGPCPCGNESPEDSRAGCLNSTGAGAKLIFEGTVDFSIGDFAFHVEDVPGGALAQLFCGPTFVAPVPLRDGLLFAGGEIQRFDVREAYAFGEVRWEFHPGLFFELGDTRYFQVIYRDADGPCGSGANFTNAVQVVFPAP